MKESKDGGVEELRATIRGVQSIIEGDLRPLWKRVEAFAGLLAKAAAASAQIQTLEQESGRARQQLEDVTRQIEATKATLLSLQQQRTSATEELARTKAQCEQATRDAHAQRDAAVQQTKKEIREDQKLHDDLKASLLIEITELRKTRDELRASLKAAIKEVSA